VHVRARALLRATCDGQLEIAGRDEERNVIREFAVSFANKDVSSTLYISGSPGSGKTALVNSVLDSLDDSGVRVITVNCMALNSVDALWERLLEEVSAGAKKPRAKSTSVKEGLDRALSDNKTKWSAPALYMFSPLIFLWQHPCSG
jgi:cell division control protein 6